MNLCILDNSESRQSLPLDDRRARHILGVLKKQEGERIRAGSPDGYTGWATLGPVVNGALTLQFFPELPAPPLSPVHVLLGTVRPIQAARIVKELTILGVGAIRFFPTELGEKSYTQSNFYTQQEYRTHALEGAEQAGNPRLPEISLAWSLKRALEGMKPADMPDNLSADASSRKIPTKILCHPDPASVRLSALSLSGNPIFLAIGTERGWTSQEIELFLQHGFSLCSLGERILKTETAAIAATSIILSRLGLL